MNPGHVAEGLFIERGSAIRRRWPRDVTRPQPGGEPVSLEGRALINPEITVMQGDQFRLHRLPVFAERAQQRDIHRQAGELHATDRGHVAPAKERTWEIK
jgi:hypothetical protein